MPRQPDKQMTLFSFLSSVPPLSSPNVLLPDNVTHSGSPCPPVLKNTLIELPPKKHGAIYIRPLHLVKSTRFKRLVNIQFLMQGCKFEQNQSWLESVPSVYTHHCQVRPYPDFRILPAFIRRRWFWGKFRATFWQVLMISVVWLLDV